MIRSYGKPVLSALLVLLVGAGSLAAAGQGEEAAEEKPTLTMQVWGGSQAHDENIEAVFELYPELAERMDIEVLVLPGEGDSIERFRSSLAAGRNIPDIMYFNYTQIGEFAHAGVLEDISDIVAQYDDVLSDGARRLTEYGGDTVGFPYELKTKVWYYRQDIFDEVGIDPDSVRTLDDFLAAGEQIQEVYPDTYIHNQGPSMSRYDLLMVYPVFDANYVDDNGTYIVDSDEGVRRAWEFFHKLGNSDVVLDVNDWEADWEAAFADGTLVSKLNASWFGLAPFLQTYAEGQEGQWAATTWPEEIARGSDAGGSVYTVPADAQHKELALEFLEKMRFSLDANIAISEKRGLFPILTDAQQQVVDMTDGHPFFAGNSYLEALQSADTHFEVFPFTPAAEAEVDLVHAQLDRYIAGEISLDEALTATQRDLESQIGDPFAW